MNLRFRISDFRFLLRVPRRYPMPPPHLPANAPIANVFHPLSVNFLPMRRAEADEMIPRDSQRLFRFWIAQEPLLANARLDRHIAPIAKPEIVFIRLRLRHCSRGLQ